MSRPSNKWVRLTLQPDGARASLWRGWLKPSKVAEQACVFDSTEAATGLECALDELLLALVEQAPIAGAVLTVEIADSLVHFDVASGDFSGASSRRLESFADATIFELLGESARSHTVRWQLQHDERHLLVCAIPNEPLQAITNAARTHRLQLGRVEPRFAVQWNQHARRRAADRAVFAVADNVNAVIACLQRGVVLAVSNAPWCVEPTHEQIGVTPVASLLVSFGLARDEDRAELDVRVDRLLAAVGVDSAAVSTFDLVASGEPPALLSGRWAVLPHAELAT